jgi:glucose-6-phosphate isomerase
VSKSGETLETKAMLHALMIFLQNTFSTRESLEKYINRHFIFCTDPAKGLLRNFCHQHSSIDTLDLPPSLGGRFSVISSVGLVPLAFLHIDGMGAVEKFISSALNERDEIKNSLAIKNAVHPLITLAANIHEQMTKFGKNETVFMPYLGRLKTLSLWFAQLWGESLGKIHPAHGPVGLTPLSAIGPSDQHSLLQLIAQGPKNKYIIFLNQKNAPSPQLREVLINSPLWEQTQNFSLQDVRDACLWGTQQSLHEVDVPSCLIEFEKLNIEVMAKLFLQLECLTVLVSLLMGIDAFDQPGVERGKILAKEFLARRQK